MDYDPDAPAEPLDKAAQKRAVNAVLMSGLIGEGLFGALLLFLMYAPGAAAIPYGFWALVGVGALGALIHGMFQLHYLMRFMWGRGEYVTMTGPDWGDHGDYFTALLIVTASGIVLIIALAGLNTLFGGG